MTSMWFTLSICLVWVLTTHNQVVSGGTTTACPFSCTQGGQHYCFHIPCPLPPCAHPVTTHGECCPHCPNGPTCTFKGTEIKVGETAQVDGLTCHCKAGGFQGLVDCV